MENEKNIVNVEKKLEFVEKHTINSVSVKVFESKKGLKCTALQIDLGYTRYFVSFDSHKIAEMMNISVHDLMNLDYGDYVLVCVK